MGIDNLIATGSEQAFKRALGNKVADQTVRDAATRAASDAAPQATRTADTFVKQQVAKDSAVAANAGADAPNSLGDWIDQKLSAGYGWVLGRLLDGHSI